MPPASAAPHAHAPLGALLSRTQELAEDLVGGGPVRAVPVMRPLVGAHLAQLAGPILLVTPGERDAEALTLSLEAFLGEQGVAHLPAWETLPHERLSPRPEVVGARLRVLDRLRKPAESGLGAVVTSVRALLQPMDPRLAEREPIRLDAHYSAGLDGLVEGLAALGYTRTPMVTQRGEMAVRGGIVDVFASAEEHPVRVEFFGDDVEVIRTFSAATQRTLETVPRIDVDAARELVLDAETSATASMLADRIPTLAEPLGLLAEGVGFEGMESLLTAIHPAPAYLPDFLPDTAGVALVDPVQLIERAATLREQAAALLEAGWGDAAAEGSTYLGDGSDAVGFAELDAVLGRIRGTRWELTPLPGRHATEIEGRGWDSLRGDVTAVAATARRLAADGDVVVLTTAGQGPARRLAEVLGGEGTGARVVEALGTDATGGEILIVPSPLAEGFHLDGIAVLGEWDLLGPRRRRVSRRLPSKRPAGEAVLDLAEGDAIVHAVHGVGRYAGMVTRELKGATTAVGGGHTGAATRDYVVLEYAGGDRLFVPSDQVDSITPYTGGENPQVMRMGGADWDRAKGKVKKAVRDMAAELIRLYQARMHAEGRGFAPDSEWQIELEQAFPHEETPDQLVAIDEVKADMEAPVPMDRLVCGDVGFGKTEIAVRAAAKAVFDGAQCAVLVPTTLLAQQHGETFMERFSGFPVVVRVLSRFAGPKEQAEILDGLAAGTIDLVVGTHRLLGKDVAFSDLGLIIVDEEQRFGVAHKERLKALRTSVDVLTMTATPIPRTMEMAITGIRDMSTIDTPPEERQPIVTHVGEWDEQAAGLALRRELLREGQVFWVHNQVSTIHAAAERVRELVPGARVAIAHGQMPEAELERVMIDFWQREADVLVSTTIIESGLDVPNANTLVVERADLLGLAQMYQLRGRVGRSTERGYAYLFFPEERSMTEEAYKRLETIGTHTGLGSGLSIALKDLEIRGAGDLLSGEQSGHVQRVGFETYGQLVAEAVTELTTGEVAVPEAEIRIDIPVDAHLPKDYITDEGLRLEMYRKVAAVRDAKGVARVREELVDRYGTLPPPAERLLSVAALRAAVRRFGVTEITTTPRKTVRVAPVHLADSAEIRLQRQHPSAILNTAVGALELPMPRDGDLVAFLARTLVDLLAAPRRRRSAGAA